MPWKPRPFFFHHLPRNGSSLGHIVGTQKVLSWWINESSNGYYESKARNAHDVTFRMLYHKAKVPTSKQKLESSLCKKLPHSWFYFFICCCCFAKTDHKSCLNMHSQGSTRPWRGEGALPWLWRDEATLAGGDQAKPETITSTSWTSRHFNLKLLSFCIVNWMLPLSSNLIYSKLTSPEWKSSRKEIVERSGCVAIHRSKH